MTTAAQLPPLTEKDWQGLVVGAATVHGWWVFHPYDSRRSTPGWPDLALLRPPEFILVELKTDRGRVAAEQRHVLDMLDACGIEAYVWRPTDEPDVLARLRHRRISPDAQAGLSVACNPASPDTRSAERSE